ncbi:UDP-glycosyltransferase 86A1-like [Cryptomeria japonica]|uniref:UDP-glycosyltransferase 86A1-like n=1 Tax=Cryptomeria japonica TaxID=3369 RepID=UPI0027D9F837|nr:UDP-glycosyltransferase 86A1-like [Cryptomeria japonica]
MAAFFLSLSNMEAHVSDLISDLNRSGVTLSCIVADTALSWAVPLAKRHALLSVSLWPNSVTNLSMFYFFHLVGLQGSIDDIPGVSSSLRTEFLDALPPPSPVRDRIAESFINVREADWVVVNSFHTLDCRAVEALRHKTPVQCVGPLNMPFTHCGHGNSASQCTQWLNSKPVRSVIYVSFGSFINVARTQVGEIAAGLMQSGYCFVWALRLDEEASHVWEMLPPGFLEECKDRRLVEPWFRQEEILSHPSVGGFFQSLWMERCYGEHFCRYSHFGISSWDQLQARCGGMEDRGEGEE